MPGGEAACFAAAARKQELPRAPSRQFEVVIDRLPSLLGDLEPDWPPGLPLPDSGSVERVTVRRHVLDVDGYDVAATQLAVDSEVEQCEVACALFELQFGS